MKQFGFTRLVLHNDFLFGMSDGGSMTTDLVTRWFASFRMGVTELCFHPSSAGSASKSIARCHEYRHEDEFVALTSKALREAMLSRNGRLQTVSPSAIFRKRDGTMLP